MDKDMIEMDENDFEKTSDVYSQGFPIPGGLVRKNRVDVETLWNQPMWKFWIEDLKESFEPIKRWLNTKAS